MHFYKNKYFLKVQILFFLYRYKLQMYLTGLQRLIYNCKLWIFFVCVCEHHFTSSKPF